MSIDMGTCGKVRVEVWDFHHFDNYFLADLRDRESADSALLTSAASLTQSPLPKATLPAQARPPFPSSTA